MLIAALPLCAQSAEPLRFVDAHSHLLPGKSQEAIAHGTFEKLVQNCPVVAK
jgi:hypothetical protein